MKKWIRAFIVSVTLIVVVGLCTWHLRKPSIPLILSQSHVLETLYILAGTKDCVITSLKGGRSASTLYKVDSSNKSYIIRLLDSHRSRESKTREISVQIIASEQGWGPKLYASDINEGWIIMEYIQPTPLTQADRMGDEIYRVLGKTLQHIHTGLEFLTVKDKVEEVEEKLVCLHTEDKIPSLIHYDILKNIIDSVKKNRSKVIVPTHRDLNPNNIIFSGHRLCIIDFEDAAQDDPFYDLATIGVFFITNSHHEKIFLDAYFNRAATQQELIYYDGMKQIVLLSFGFSFLKRISREVIKNVAVPLEPFKKLLQEYNKGSFDISNHINQLKFAISLLQEAINQYNAEK